MSLAASITPAWRGGVKHAGVAWWRGQARRSLVRGTRGNVAKHAAYVVKHAAYVVKQAGIAWWREHAAYVAEGETWHTSRRETRGIRGKGEHAAYVVKQTRGIRGGGRHAAYVVEGSWCAPGGGSEEAATSGRAPLWGGVWRVRASGAEPPLKPPLLDSTGRSADPPASHGRCVPVGRSAPGLARVADAAGRGVAVGSARGAIGARGRGAGAAKTNGAGAETQG